ncbi:MAG: hypothetical protein JSV54_07960 [Chloroflexota bacterium]|nr:MAG: hypothetical protein JSV54_07960 [Chloroflexota bacterium]
MISKLDSRTAFAIWLAPLLALFLLLSIFNAACAPKTPVTEPPVTKPPITQPPTEQPSAPPTLPSQPTQWSADGVITDKEYTKTKSFGDYEIYWTGDDQYIYIGMRAKTSGWLAVGIQPGTKMKDADMVMGLVSDGKVSIFDFFCVGDYGPHSPDIELGGTNDILEFGGQENEGYTIIEFKRSLNTSDKYDLPITKGTNKIIWSYSLDEQSTKKHVSRGYGEIDL